jgi:hypothetical protein
MHYLVTNYMERYPVEKLMVPKLINKFPPFMEPESLLLCLQILSVVPALKFNQPSPFLPSCCFKIGFCSILPFTPGFLQVVCFLQMSTPKPRMHCIISILS